MVVPYGHFLQKVTVGQRWMWRIAKDPNCDMNDYLTNHKELQTAYRVLQEKQTTLPLFDQTSKFLKRWDALALLLLLFTASVTPWETAFITTLTVDLLFLINTFVDFIFMCDIFVQMRTPYRDAQTGKQVSDGNRIARRYLSTWFPIDLMSVIPFEMLGFLPTNGDTTNNLSELRLLKFLRLTRLLKLLRVLRASRKLRQWQVHINLRYATLQIVQYSVVIIFVIHWLACGYRLAADKDGSGDATGWTDNYKAYKDASNSSAVTDWELYLIALYWSSATVSLVGANMPAIAPSNVREYGYILFANFVSYMNAVYFIATISDVLAMSSRMQRTHDLKVDQYLEMFDRLKLDTRLKIKVHDYLSEHYALAASSSYSELLKELPQQLHGFITMEIFIEFLSQVPFLEVFIDREPVLMQELCRNVEIRSFPANSHIFTDGYEGIYFLERGVCAIEGVVYTTGQVFGRSVLRERNKATECRALTTVTIHLLSRGHLLACFEKYPKIHYYAKRWTAWAVLRRYMRTYAQLYYVAARRGLKVYPPLLSKRPHMREMETDDIDSAVMDHMQENGF
ncbi:hypothetical protein HK101_004967 [Irineochytrium annulatum]|nr:hypothetical protein HK101_004967 [Irineochytrium annulatum]